MKNFFAKFTVLVFSVVLVLTISGCFVILTITQPSSIMGLQQFTSTVQVQVQGASDPTPHFAIVGLRIPNDWNVDSVWFTGAYNGRCTFLHPDSTDREPGGLVDFWTDSLEARFPSGASLKWVVYQSTTSHLTLVDTVVSNLFVRMTPGITQGNFNLGYFVTNAALDFTDPRYYSVRLTNPITVSGIIPVELTSFEAVGTKNGIQLNWETASEVNNQGFEIERSSNNQLFSKVGFVEGKGTTAQKSSYTFLDKNIYYGKYNYRLKQVDFDGAYEYSKIIEIDYLGSTEFYLSQNYPNPFNPVTLLRFGLPVESDITLAVYNSVGELVEILKQGTLQAGPHSYNFDAAGLPSGTYLFTLSAKGIDGAKFTETKKILLIK